MDDERMVGARVMSEEQTEQLRKQIAAFSVICHRLAHMHPSITSLYFTTTPGTQIFVSKTSSNRQRWSPTAAQLQILERIYGEGNGSPARQRIREITAQLTLHGPVTDTNVYNWFQNRRARSKRSRHHLPAAPSAPTQDNTTITKSKPDSLDAQVSLYLQDPEQDTGPVDKTEAGKSYYNPYDLLEQIKWIKDDAFH